MFSSTSFLHTDVVFRFEFWINVSISTCRVPFDASADLVVIFMQELEAKGILADNSEQPRRGKNWKRVSRSPMFTLCTLSSHLTHSASNIRSDMFTAGADKVQR
jgi:hypothetical protein